MKSLILENQFSHSMDIQEEKLLLIEQLLRIDDARIIQQMRDLITTENNPVVGYEANGSPVTHRDFIKKIEESESDYKAGNYQTLEELDKESERW